MQEVPETYQQRLSCVASDREMERQLPLSLCEACLMYSLQAGTILSMLDFTQKGQI